MDFGIIVLKSKTSSEFNMVLHSADWTVLAQGPSDQALMNQSLAASLLDSLILGSRQGFGSPKLKLQCAFPPDELRKLVTGDCSLVHWESGPIEEPAWTQKARAIFSGSFNPLHSGHRKLADAAAQWLSLPVVFEIPIQNADKPPLDYLSLKHRLAQFSDRAVILSKAPTFREKAELLPDSVFVIGMDTAERIFQSKFYGDPLQGVPDALSIIAACRCRFLVAGRIQEGEFRTLQDLDVPVEFRHLFSELPPDLFREDISSSVIRERNPQWGEFF